MTQQQTSVGYLAGPDETADRVREIAARNNIGEPLLVKRRGTVLGWIAVRPLTDIPRTDTDAIRQAWRTMSPVKLPGYVADQLLNADGVIKQSLLLVDQILDGSEFQDLLMQEPYESRLAGKFEAFAGSVDESDPQEIVKLDFDALQNQARDVDDLWAKISWLSFDEDDVSMRFRFSYGIEGHEDVAADYRRECLAAELAETVFPESSLVSNNSALAELLKGVLGFRDIAYVERIIYFNAPNGGAQFHQDVERGHAGVVFAQLYGQTAWLALSKETLMDEIRLFLNTEESESGIRQLIPDQDDLMRLRRIAESHERLSEALDFSGDSAGDSADNIPPSMLMELILNHSPAFFRQLVNHGYAYILAPGDLILLPQQDLNACVWHSVFCIGDVAGHALSFAIRETPG